MRERRLLFLASKPAGTAPSQRYRLEQWTPHLAAKHGIQVDLAPFESEALADVLYRPGHFASKALLTMRDFIRRAGIVSLAQHYDAIVVHREAALIGPAVYELLLARTGKPIIYDFDDAIWSPAQAQTNGPFAHLHFYGKTSAICRMASAVTTGNEFLASYARTRNKRVFVIPSSIELAQYPFIPEAAEPGRFVVCWTGSTSTLAHFERARAALERLAEKVSLVVKLICSKPPERPIAGAETRFIPWSADREAEEVGGCNVGIMPLPDDEISRGKCAMKALQFMATSRPVVISPVGVNTDIVRPGQNGLLASSVDEWVEALSQLAASPELRARLGANARSTVETGYSAELSASRFAKVVDLVVG